MDENDLKAEFVLETEKDWPGSLDSMSEPELRACLPSLEGMTLDGLRESLPDDLRESLEPASPDGKNEYKRQNEGLDVSERERNEMIKKKKDMKTALSKHWKRMGLPALKLYMGTCRECMNKVLEKYRDGMDEAKLKEVLKKYRDGMDEAKLKEALMQLREIPDKKVKALISDLIAPIDDDSEESGAGKHLFEEYQKQKTEEYIKAQNLKNAILIAKSAKKGFYDEGANVNDVMDEVEDAAEEAAAQANLEFAAESIKVVSEDMDFLVGLEPSYILEMVETFLVSILENAPGAGLAAAGINIGYMMKALMKIRKVKQELKAIEEKNEQGKGEVLGVSSDWYEFEHDDVTKRLHELQVDALKFAVKAASAAVSTVTWGAGVAVGAGANVSAVASKTALARERATLVKYQLQVRSIGKFIQALRAMQLGSNKDKLPTKDVTAEIITQWCTEGLNDAQRRQQRIVRKFMKTLLSGAGQDHVYDALATAGGKGIMSKTFNRAAALLGSVAKGVKFGEKLINRWNVCNPVDMDKPLCKIDDVDSIDNPKGQNKAWKERFTTSADKFMLAAGPGLGLFTPLFAGVVSEP